MRSSFVLCCVSLIAACALPAAAQAGVGGQVWSQASCGGCHTLAAAGSSGNGGPNLDQVRPSSSAVAAQVASGGGGMPSFSSSLSSTQIAALAQYVASVAGSPGGGTAGSGGSAGSPAPNGMSPAAVRRLQSGLARLGFFHHVVTGFYGPVTTRAVKRFQRAEGLKPDGIWGSKSTAALKRLLNGP